VNQDEDISEILKISLETVKTHHQNIRLISVVKKPIS
jgi:DNA-binding CsgD family transcriptional regulator